MRVMDTEHRGRGRPSTGTKIQVRIPADVLDDLDWRAERDGTTRAALVRQILTEWARGRVECSRAPQ